MKKQTLLGTLLGLSLLSSATVAHIEQSEPLQSLRQSYFALLGMTFGPMGDMVKGKIEWDNALFTTWANDLNHAAQFGVERGFAPAVWEIGSLLFSGSPLYFIFHIQTRAHYFTQTIMCGGAQYRATGRGFAIKHDMFDESYRFFASSHFYLGADLCGALGQVGRHDGEDTHAAD